MNFRTIPDDLLSGGLTQSKRFLPKKKPQPSNRGHNATEHYPNGKTLELSLEDV
jgi:hypothetical protein